MEFVGIERKETVYREGRKIGNRTGETVKERRESWLEVLLKKGVKDVKQGGKEK